MGDMSLINVASHIASDIASVLGIPTTALGATLRSYIERQQEVALKILLEELTKGKIDDLHVAAEDERVAIVYQYFIAARNGAARRNLRLLARSIIGLARRDRLFVDEFSKYQHVLERLTRDQIVVVGCYLTEFSKHSQGIEAWKSMVSNLVPNDFPTDGHLRYIINECVALGLIVPASGYGMLVYHTSPLLHEITELTDFTEILAEERARPT